VRKISSSTRFQESFPHDYDVRFMPDKPLIAPARYFVYPTLVDEIERDAAVIEVLPKESAPWTGAFALGFAADTVVSGVFSCPDPKWICVIAGGYAYLVDTEHPETFIHLRPRPVVRVMPVPAPKLLLFCDFASITAVGEHGIAWETPALTWEGLSLGKIENGLLHGTGWDALKDVEVPFTVELATGRCQGGASPASQRNSRL